MDDEEEPPPTFEILFELYSNCNTDPFRSDDNKYYYSILLSQIDYWMKRAKILHKLVGTTDTGLAYMKFNKWRLDFEEFLLFLQDVCQEKNLSVNMIKDMLYAAGKPDNVTTDKSKAK